MIVGFNGRREGRGCTKYLRRYWLGVAFFEGTCIAVGTYRCTNLFLWAAGRLGLGEGVGGLGYG